MKQGVLIQRLMTIEENFQELEDIIVERRFKCEEEEQQVAGFQEKMNNMFDWIHSKEQELGKEWVQCSLCFVVAIFTVSTSNFLEYYWVTR